MAKTNKKWYKVLLRALNRNKVFYRLKRSKNPKAKQTLKKMYKLNRKDWNFVKKLNKTKGWWKIRKGQLKLLK